MKKILIYGLSLALLLSLTACHKSEPEQPTEPTTTPAATSEPAQEPNTPEQLSSKDQQDNVGLIEDQGSKELQEISHDELIAVFQQQYDISKSIYNSDDEETISSELGMIKIVVENMDKTLPSDYEAQYRAWRPSVTQQTEASSEATLTFTSVNEQVWATGTVNLRSGPSTEDTKVGSLNKGNSVTRIGVGTGDYASWSKVKPSDGSEVYVASSYLTTTKPATGGSQQNQGGTGSTGGKGGTGATGGQTQQPVQQEPSSGDRGTIGLPPNVQNLTEDEAHTGVKDPFLGSDKVTIGYGG